MPTLPHISCKYGLLRTPILWLFFCGVASIIFTTTAAAQDSDPEANSESVTAEELRQLAEVTRRLRFEIREIERTRWSSRPNTVEEAVRQIRGAKTPENIFNWVKNNIEFEPYAGALRGPNGALAAGAANSIDQALLVSEMCRVAGFKTRFVTGTIYPRDMIEMLRQFAGEAVLGGPAVADGFDFTREDASQNTRYVQLLQNHVWIEVEDGGEFRPLDPVVAPLYGMTTSVANLRSETMPEMFQTALEIQLVARLKDKQEIVLLTAAGPLSLYAYRALTLGFVPDSDLKGMLRPTFTLDGQIIRGQHFPPAELSVLELRYKLSIGRRQSRWTQTLFGYGAGVDIFSFDQQHFSIGVLPGWTSDAQVAAMGNRAAREAVQKLDEWIDERRQAGSAKVSNKVLAEETATTIHSVLDDLGPLLPFAFVRTLDRITLKLAEVMGVRPIIQSPRVVTTMIVRQGSEYFVDVDLSGDILEAMPQRGIPQMAATSFLTMYGRIKNQLEGAVLEATTGEKSVAVNQVFLDARRARTPFTTVHVGTTDHIDLLDTDPHLRDEIRDLVTSRGMIVLVPIKRVSIDERPHFGWWALHPQSGILQGTTQGGLLDVKAAAAGSGQVAVADTIRSTLRLSTQLYSTAIRSAQGATSHTPLICEAGRDVQTISRALCATSTPFDLPSLHACLTKRPAPKGTDILSFTTPPCEAQVDQTRCGAVIAQAFLDGRLAVLTPQLAAQIEAAQALAAQEGGEDVDIPLPEAPICY